MTLPADAWRAVHRVLTRLRDALAALVGRPARRERGDQT